jgi:hypothetical protein
MSKKQKVMTFLRTALLSDNAHERLRELSLIQGEVDEHSRRADEYINNYIADRRKKVALIDEKIVSKSEDCENTDLEEFEKRLAEKKPGFGPNIDFFTLPELEELIKEFNKEKGHQTISDVTSRTSRRSSMSARSSATMAELFEKNLGSSGSQKEEVKRRQTKILEGTMLTQKNSIVCKISNVKQEVERHVKGLIKTKTEFFMTVSSFPFGWKVVRSH